MSVRRMRTEQKMECVANIARNLFVERGFYNVSIPDIVKASGVSVGSIYHHFSNKENIARYIQDNALIEFQAHLLSRLEGKTSAYEKLRVFAELLLDIAESDPTMVEYMLFMKHGEFVSDICPICFSEPFMWVQDVVKEGMTSGDIKEGLPIVVAGSFTGVVFRNIAMRLTNVLEKPLDEVAELIIENAWAAIKA